MLWRITFYNDGVVVDVWATQDLAETFTKMHNKLMSLNFNYMIIEKVGG